MDYEFMVYICEGTESEKLDWFKIVNVAGEELTPQGLEIPFILVLGSRCKEAFSKSNCAAKGLSDKYITGTPIRRSS